MGSFFNKIKGGYSLGKRTSLVFCPPVSSTSVIP